MSINNMLNTGTSFPSTDGSAGDVLQTDGTGVISWQPQSGGGINYPGVYVSQALGNDLNPGTYNSPVATISQGISLVPVFSGIHTTVFIMDGETYDENVSINIQGVNIDGPFATVQPSSGDGITMTGNFVSTVNLYALSTSATAINLMSNGNLTINVNQFIAGDITNNSGSITVKSAFYIGNMSNVSGGSISGELDQIYFGSTFTPSSGAINILNNFQFDTGSSVWGNNEGHTFLTTPIINPDSNSNVIYADVNLDYSDFPSLFVLYQAGNASASYKVRNIQITTGTNFSGGNRDLQISDNGGNVFTTIPAVALATLSNSQWGSINVPYPVSAPMNTASTPGHNIYATYVNGTTNYITGNFNVILELERIV